MQIADKKIFFLRLSFIVGAILDGLLAINWFLISVGIELPDLMTGYHGNGQDYQFAMYIAAMFMASWTVLLAWGYFKPYERKGLLLIVVIFLSLAIVIDVVFLTFRPEGLSRLFVVILFSFSLFFARKQD